MKLYVENTENKMTPFMLECICGLMHKFMQVNDSDRMQLVRIRDFKDRYAYIQDCSGTQVNIETGEEYDMHWLKITAMDSSYQLESDLMDLETWVLIWGWLDTVASMRAIPCTGK